MDMLQTCLDVSNSAIALFDLIEKEGVDSPLNNIDNLEKLTNLIKDVKKIKEYYYRRNVQRMLALGHTPEDILKISESID